MVEGASIDKRAHAADAERMIWDVIEFDRAVQVALDFAAAHQHRSRSGQRHAGDRHRRPRDRRPRDHRRRQRALRAGGARQGRARLRRGLPLRAGAGAELRSQLPGRRAGLSGRSRSVAEDPARVGRGPRSQRELDVEPAPAGGGGGEGEAGVSVRQPGARRVGAGERQQDRRAASAIPGFLVRGTIENGETPCPSSAGCPGDTASLGHTISGHTASDVPLSASGPGAWQFTGVYENSDVLLKMLRATRGSYPPPGGAPRAAAPSVRGESGSRPPAVRRASRSPIQPASVAAT